VIRQRRAPAEVLAEEEGASLAAIRALDDYHLARCRRVHAEFDAALRPHERPAIAEHREQLAEALAPCKAVAIAGGHVASLLNRMRMFGLPELIGARTVFAWSGGGMVISERLVLFHDSPPQGRGASELVDEGLGLVPGVVVLPHPETRLRLDDPERVGLLARRFAPGRCLAFPEGAHLHVHEARPATPNAVIHLREDGTIAAFDCGAEEASR
jgi:peptidase E